MDGNEAIVRKLIAGRETNHVEFKSSARWNYRKEGHDPAMELAVIKTVASFMNATGGTLIIGVDDEGQVLGLDNDYKLTPTGNRDGFELWLQAHFARHRAVCEVSDSIFYPLAIRVPRPLCFVEWIKFLLLPSDRFVTKVMKGAVVDGTERYRPFITHLAAEGPWLGEADVRLKYHNPAVRRWRG